MRTRLSPEERKASIIVAGIALAKCSGYSRLTCKKIAEAAGIPRSLIHYHFGSWRNVREALLAQAAREDEYQIIMQAMAIKDPALKVSVEIKNKARKFL
jgi:AcrR family transcriptional regulator